METREFELQEKPKFDLFIDYVRHARYEGGPALRDVVRRAGSDSDTLGAMPKTSDAVNGDVQEQLEGRVTDAGEEGMRESARTLAGKIEKDKEIVAILPGPRTRHIQSAEIFADELERQGIKVLWREGQRSHKDLIDFQRAWYSLVEYIVQQQGKSNVDLEVFWWEMYRNQETRDDMNVKGYEHLGDVAKRMEYTAELLRRYARRYKSRFQGKTLRVICMTSDVDLEQIMQMGKPLEEREQIWPSYGDVVEVRIPDVTDNSRDQWQIDPSREFTRSTPPEN